MSDVVVDASVAIKALFPEPHSDRALALLEDTVRAAARLSAPHLLPAEVTNMIRRRMRRERLSLAVAMATLEDFLAQPFELLGGPDLHRRALTLTEAFSLGGHDAHYVALAQQLNCDMWTGDERILRAVGGHLPFVRWIGDYASPAGDTTRTT